MTFQREKLFHIGLLVYAVSASLLTLTDGGDFDVFLDAAQKLNRHENIYAPPYIKEGLLYYYSVFFAMVLVPGSYAWYVTEFLWCLLSCFLLYRSYQIICTYLDLDALSAKKRRLWLLLTLVLAFQFIQGNIAMIQMTPFLLWGMLESIRLSEKGRFLLAGLIMGVIINIKIMPLLLLPYFFYRGYFGTLLTSIGVVVLLLFLPALFIGVEYNNFLLQEWWKVINPTNKEHLFETGIGSHSIVSMLPVYLTETTGEMEYRRHIVNLPHHQVEWVINVARLCILGCSLFFFRSWPFQRENNRLKSFWEICFFLLIIPLLMPHQQKYNFLLAIPMASYLLYFFLRSYSRNAGFMYKFVFWTFAISMLLVYSPVYGPDIISRFMFRFTQHYRLMTFPTLLLIPIGLYCNPLKLKP